VPGTTAPRSSGSRSDPGKASGLEPRRCAVVAAGQRADVVDELGWVADLEVGTEHAEVDSESVEGRGAGTQQAGVLVDHLQQPDPGGIRSAGLGEPRVPVGPAGPRLGLRPLDLHPRPHRPVVGPPDPLTTPSARGDRSPPPRRPRSADARGGTGRPTRRPTFSAGHLPERPVPLHRTPPVSHDQDAGEFTWSSPGVGDALHQGRAYRWAGIPAPDEQRRRLEDPT
jgi:hypothetical protein